MRFPRVFVVTIVLGLAMGAAFADKSLPAPASTPPPAILPQQFGGWEMQGTPQTGKDAAAVDPANAAVLKEYGFSDLASAAYTRDDGRTLKIRAARFADATGAFGAYTFYLQPEMTKEQIGDQGASLGQRVLFYRGHVLIEALFSKESVMAGGELRELAGLLPRPPGNAANLPSFIAFMPHRGYVANTQKYAIGPLALEALAPPVPASLVDFGASSEVTLARYSTSSGEATLMLISYPTPQMAAEHLKRIDAAHQMAQPQSGVSVIESSGPFFDKRTGPIIAIATGPVSDSDAKSLLGMVNYEASVTWNQAEDHQARELYSLLLNTVILCAILGALAIVAGVAFGGVRVLMKRLYPERVFDRPEQMEFISLHLGGSAPETGPSRGSGARPEGPQSPA